MRLSYLFSFILLPIFTYSQTGGTGIFRFLDLSTNARVSAIGGQNISIKNSELGIAFKAPSLLDSTYVNTFSGSRAGHFESQTAISYGNLVYANEFKKYTYFVGVNYVNYGYFDGYDEFGVNTGSFSANDFLFAIGISKQLNSLISIGASIKPIYSQLESYKSFAIASDYSATLNDNSRLVTATVLIRNVGTQIIPYTNGNYETLPWGIDIGITKKLQHAPLRLSFTYHDLQSFNTYYSKAKTTNTFNQTEDSESKFSTFGKNFLSHFILGAEILIFKNLFLAGGYNFKKGQEMTLTESKDMVGFSFGFGLKVYKFHLSYGHEKYHVNGGTNIFSVRTELNNFNRKTRIKENIQ